MKKLGLFFVLFSLMLLTSCEKEEENTTSEEVVTEEEEVDGDGEEDINEGDEGEEDIDDDEEDDDINNNQGDDEGEEDTDKEEDDEEEEEDEISLEERLIGTWNSEETITTKSPLADISESSEGTMTFNKDGSGTKVYDNEEESFTWTVNSSNELIINDEVTMSNDVNEVDKQEFSGTHEEGVFSISAVLKLSK
tara:strand:- start:294 stop:875 length:582 start_codon:yes stop_codon:yes gene_type:complete